MIVVKMMEESGPYFGSLWGFIFGIKYYKKCGIQTLNVSRALWLMLSDY